LRRLAQESFAIQNIRAPPQRQESFALHQTGDNALKPGGAQFMPNKKAVGKRKPASKSKSRAAKPRRKSKVGSARKSTARISKAAVRKPSPKAAAARRPSGRARGEEELRSANLSRGYYEGKVELEDGDPTEPRGTGSESAGQSGDLQGLSEVEESESESVEELVEEGQDFEAELVAGVERAGDATESGVPIRKRQNEFDFDPEEDQAPQPPRKGRRGSR